MSFPNEAYEKGSPHMSLDEFILGTMSASYMLTVESDSMQEAGIYRGDHLIVERTDSASMRDIVIVARGGHWEMSYFRELTEDDRLEAVVRAVIRRYV